MIIEINVDPVEHIDEGKRHVERLLLSVDVPKHHIQPLGRSYQYVFASLTRREARALVRADYEQAGGQPSKRAVRRIWPDEPLTPYINRSIRTVKADACRVAFGAEGEGIVWAVIDSGIEQEHPHFEVYENLQKLPEGLAHRNFLDNGDDAEALADAYGHGTHVAGVLAGETCPMKGRPMYRMSKQRDAENTVRTSIDPLEVPLRGVAPKCKILSLKVIDDSGNGYASALIAALEYVARLNGDGRYLRVHGVNLSLGYPFDAEWYAAGHSPVCTVVNRLSKDGVVVVAASGNDGSAFLQTEGRINTRRVGVDQSINDPGNADEAITVGATHAESPHTYGVSFFSSRGPTADGRAKPDLVAPGERILSCAATKTESFKEALQDAEHAFDTKAAYFREDSGTSMAAPHVSGAAAALMSVKPETRGNPAMVKDILVRSCTDLKRKADFQGAGLLDLMRAIQLT
ncbi:S8 family peptidase [Roseitranquillus sediminis]|uniref:S8 family peptidase n=1 Tax=Roseitranquillus sediminis TaxID=2809051 RepID=UPI001D0C2295|nr:S8 family peptidase [Roseitranquillus sediminis]MBM9594462.1 S8 family peptidase [Roseitranquillus sediminis]